MRIRNCTENDVDAVRDFVTECRPLGIHTPYTYWTLFRYFSEGCFVMEESGKIIGYVSGMKSATGKDVFFLWQLGVAKGHRGKGYSHTLIDKIAECARNCKCKRIELTIEPGNVASLGTFSSYAKKHGLNMKKIGEMSCIGSRTGKEETDYIYGIRI